MNPSMSVDESRSCVTDLIKTMNENCKTAENLAIETLTSYDAPFISAFRELTRGDCLQIMRKQEMFNVLEQAIVLSGLTDYLTCAYQNELFDTFRKKQDRDHFSSLMFHLNGKWIQFFHKLGRYDLTYAQLNSIVFLLKYSLKRLPTNYRTVCMRDSLLMGENSLERARMQSYKDSTQFIQLDDEENPAVSKSSEHCDISIKSVNGIAVINHKSSTCDVEPLHKSKCNENKIKISQSKWTSCNSKPSNLQKRINKPSVVLPPSQPILKTQQRKYNADITKYILKSSENKDKESITANISVSGTDGKENQNQESSSFSTGIELDTKLKDPGAHITPTEKLNSIVGAESPSKKKLRLDNKITVNKVNAFEVMMRQSRAIKSQNIKRKSLFQ